MSNVEYRPEIKDGSPEDNATVENKQNAYRSRISINELWSWDETLMQRGLTLFAQHYGHLWDCP